MQVSNSLENDEYLRRFANAKGVEGEYLQVAPLMPNEEFPAWKGLVPSTHEQLIENIAEVKEFLYRTHFGKFVWHDIFRQNKFGELDFRRLKEIVTLADIKTASDEFYKGKEGAANVVADILLNDYRWPATYIRRMKEIFDDFEYNTDIERRVLGRFDKPRDVSLAAGHANRADDILTINEKLGRGFDELLQKYEKLLSSSEKIESDLGVKPFSENQIYDFVLRGLDYSDTERLLEEISGGRIVLSPEFIEFLKKKPGFFYNFGYRSEPNDTPDVVGRRRMSHFITRVEQAREGRGQRYPGSQFLDGQECEKIEAVKSFLKNYNHGFAEQFVAFFKKLEDEDSKYANLAEKNELFYAGFRLVLHEPQELLNARRNKKEISPAERIMLMQNIERSFKAASWVARSALEVEDMYKTIQSDVPEKEKLESLESSVRYMHAACGSQKGIVFDAPPLHGGNGGEDAVGFDSPRSYQIMKNIFQKHGEEHINSVEYSIKRDTSIAKITIYQFSSEPKEPKTGDSGIAIKVTYNGKERYLGTEDILMLKNDLSKETFATLVLNGKLNRYALLNAD